MTAGEKNVPTPGPERAKLNRELAQMLKGGVIMDVTRRSRRASQRRRARAP